MTADTSSPPPVVPVHWAVPGRLRARVAGLHRDADAIARFLGRARHDRAIVAARVNFLTGTVLVHYRQDLSLQQVLDRLTLAAQGGGCPPVEAGEEPWHVVTAEAALTLVGADGARGLPATEAQRRLSLHGPNRLTLPHRRSHAAILAGQFVSLPVALLAGSAIASLMTGGALEAVAILVVVAVNGLIGAGCEAQAERMIAQLDRQHRRMAVVRRDEKPCIIDADLVVPGDLLVLSPGQFIPADARLVEDRGLVIDESVLTGESLPVTKCAQAALDQSCPLADRENMVWRGTLVAGGVGLAVVVATGRDTEIGRIQAMVGDLESPQTPLQRKLDRLGRTLVVGSAALCAVMVLLGAARGLRLAALLRTATALAVAAIPEGLPTVATLSLAQAVRALKRKGVLIRRLEAVETLGVVSTVFFDKTGTLTLNSMSVAELRADGAEPLWRIAALCSDATAERRPDGSWRVEGSPTECALIQAALDHGIDVAALRGSMPRLSERYRDDRRQSMATLHDLAGGRRLLAVKGSPLDVLAACSLGTDERKAVAVQNEAMARRGLRVLGFASAQGGAGVDIESQGLEWLGLVGLADPLRPGTAEFLAHLRDDGVESVMLTGDQAPTAWAVACDLGMVGGPRGAIADAAAVETLPPAALAAVAKETRVFARIQPGHKLRVVQAFRHGGHVVAMVGDGVNDGPALKAADIGITMGRHGSPAARDLSDLVLENDELAGLAEAIKRGRLTHANIRKSVTFLVATNLSEMLLMLATVAMGTGGALSPLQLLWINLVTDVLPGLALAREPAEIGERWHPPDSGADNFLGRREALRMTGDSVTMAAGALGAFAFGRMGGDAVRASTLATTSLVTSQMLYALTGRSHRRWGGGPNPTLDLAIGGTLAAHAAALAIPGVRRLLGLASLSPGDLAVAVGTAMASYLLNEARKPTLR